MKCIFLIIFLSLSIHFSFADDNRNNKTSNSNNQFVNITLIDNITKEKLTGVKNKISNDYSDFDGVIKIKKGEDIDLSFISYESVKIKKINNDTIIIMKIVK